MSPSDHNYDDFPYDVESSLTSIPVQETIDYIELKPFCKKCIFKKLLRNLQRNAFFPQKNRLIKQIAGCPMGGPISVVLSGIFVCKMKEDIVTPSKLLFYKHYVGDTYVSEKKIMKLMNFTMC